MSETLRDINEKNDDEDKTWSASQSMLIHWSSILKHTLGFIIWNTQIYALEMGVSETAMNRLQTCYLDLEGLVIF